MYRNIQKTVKKYVENCTYRNKNFYENKYKNIFFPVKSHKKGNKNIMV